MGFAGWSRSAGIFGRCAAIVVPTVLALALGGCLTLGNGTPPALDLTDFWQGVSVVHPGWPGANGAGLGFGKRFISLTLLERGTKLSGYYGCSPGTAECLDEGTDQNGVISSGAIGGNEVTFRVNFRPDGLSCIFQGWFSLLEGQGSYHCYVGAALIEMGEWQVRRAGVAPEPKRPTPPNASP